MSEVTNNNELSKSSNLTQLNKTKSDSYIYIENSQLSSSILSNKEKTNKSAGYFINESIQNLAEDNKTAKGNKNNKDFFSQMSESFTNLKNTLKFNLISTSKQLDLKSEGNVYISGVKYNFKNKNNSEIFSFLIENFIYLSYRNSFFEIKSKYGQYTTDCGWGCMIRSAQMILAKVILETKKKNLVNLKKDVNFNILKGSILETILLFSDNFLRVHDVLGNPDFNYYKIKKHIDSSCKKSVNRVSSIVQMEFVEHEEIDEYFISKMYPPFSIQIISTLGEIYNKGAGKTYSDINCIRIFEELNNEFKPLPDLELYWTESTIIESELVQRFLVKVEEPNDKDNYFIHKNEFYDLKKASSNKDNQNNNDSFTFDKAQEEKAITGCLFISFRLGIEKISSEYFPLIINLFKIHGNIGIIGGRDFKGYYYFGVNENDELFFLDPHLNQKSFQSKADLNENCLTTYIPYYYYKIHISKISPAFTVCFMFHSIDEFSSLIETLKDLSEKDYNIITFGKETKDKVSKTLYFTGVEDDFDLVDYEK